MPTPVELFHAVTAVSTRSSCGRGRTASYVLVHTNIYFEVYFLPSQRAPVALSGLPELPLEQRLLLLRRTTEYFPFPVFYRAFFLISFLLSFIFRYFSCLTDFLSIYRYRLFPVFFFPIIFRSLHYFAILLRFCTISFCFFPQNCFLVVFPISPRTLFLWAGFLYVESMLSSCIYRNHSTARHSAISPGQSSKASACRSERDNASKQSWREPTCRRAFTVRCVIKTNEEIEI